MNWVWYFKVEWWNEGFKEVSIEEGFFQCGLDANYSDAMKYLEKLYGDDINRVALYCIDLDFIPVGEEYEEILKEARGEW